MPSHSEKNYTAPFYVRHPVRFQCTGCGGCCRGGRDATYVFLSADEAESIRDFLGLSSSWFRRRYLLNHPEQGLVLRSRENGDCIFLNVEGKCRIYPVRPGQCASYPFWPELMRSAKAWSGEAKHCEGIGQGPVISANNIEHILVKASVD